MSGFKIKNNYAKAFPAFDETPKAVVAAIAMSFAIRICEENIEEAQKLISEEWEILHSQEIIPQKPKKGAAK
ncbi:hypothetical protein [Escherichia coli]|uniref:hypothetical protein n=1 Tax=Escherichia coli TaxID=562 RepID=UPI003CE47A69